MASITFLESLTGYITDSQGVSVATTELLTVVLIASETSSTNSLATTSTDSVLQQTSTSYYTSVFTSDSTTPEPSIETLPTITGPAELPTVVPFSASSGGPIDGSSNTAGGGSQIVTTRISTSAGVSSSASAKVLPSNGASQGGSMGASTGAGIGIVCTILVFGLIAAIMFYVRRRRRVPRETKLHQKHILGGELDSEPRLADIFLAGKDKHQVYHRDLSAGHEVHELDVRTSRVLPAKLKIVDDLEVS